MNWDKPARLENYIYANDLNDLHGTELSGGECSRLIGVESGDNSVVIYEKYLNYCKLRLSPLYQALG